MTRTLKFPLVRFESVQVRPQVSELDPYSTLVSLVGSEPSLFAVVHVVPPSQDNSTLTVFVPPVFFNQ